MKQQNKLQYKTEAIKVGINQKNESMRQRKCATKTDNGLVDLISDVLVGVHALIYVLVQSTRERE